MIKIKAFGKISELIDKEEFMIDNPKDTLSLRSLLVTQYPALKDFNFQLAVDRKMVTGQVGLEDNQEVALLPPFSGG